MPYFPSITPSELEDLTRFLDDELNRINPSVIEGQEFYGFNIHTSEPGKPEVGQIAYADGTGWNPNGDGEGTYEYTTTGWKKLSGVNTGSGVAWGNITGTLSDQTDLQTALDFKTDEVDFLAHTGDIDIHYSDAPADSQDYVRNDNAWIVAATGGGQFNIDGGTASSLYNPPANIDGGGA